MLVPAVSSAHLGMRRASIEQTGIDIGILRPVRLASAPVDMCAPSILQTNDKTAGPKLAGLPNPRTLDSVHVVDGEAMPDTVEATEDLHEMIEMCTIPFRAPQ
jgi:hypothetical protein